MRHWRLWLTCVLALALLPGCALFHQSEARMEQQMGKKKHDNEQAPQWDPVRDMGDHYTALKGPFRVRDLAELSPSPGKTFFVMARDWVRGPEGLASTESGVVYLEQQAVKAMETEGYVHVTQGRADYGLEIHVLCADTEAPEAKGSKGGSLALPDAFDKNFPFPWTKEYHTFGADPAAVPGSCRALVLLAVHVQAEDGKSRDVFVQRFSVGGCRNERACPFSACGYAAGKAVAEELGRIF